jgi:hypothetical protein
MQEIEPIVWSAPEKLHVWAAVFKRSTRTLKRIFKAGAPARARKFGQLWQVAVEDIPIESGAKWGQLGTGREKRNVFL